MSNLDKIQKEFINILLKNIDCVEKYIQSNDKKIFDAKYHQILDCIIEQYNNDKSLLTRKSFQLSILNKKLPNKELAENENLFNSIFIINENKNNYFSLLKTIQDISVKKKMSLMLKKLSEDSNIDTTSSLNNLVQDASYIKSIIENQNIPKKYESIKDYPIDGFCSELKDLIKEGSASFKNCCYSLIGTSLLGSLSAAIGNSVECEIKRNFNVKPILWSIISLPPALGKTPITNIVSRPFQKIDKELYDEYKEKKKEWENWEEKKKDKKDKTVDLTNPFEKIEKPIRKSIIVSESTVETMITTLYYNSISGINGILVVKDEMTGLTNSFNQHKGGKGNDKDIWLSFHSGSYINKKLSGEEYCIDNPHLSIIGGTQPEKLKTHWFTKDNVSDGWVQRFLITQPHYSYSEMTDEEIKDTTLDNYEKLIRNLVFNPTLSCGNYQYHSLVEHQSNNSVKRIIKLSKEAQEYYKNFEREITDLQKSNPEILAPIFGKMIDVSAKIATIFHICKEKTNSEFANSDKSKEIQADTIKDAIELTKWYIDTTVRLTYSAGLVETQKVTLKVKEPVIEKLRKKFKGLFKTRDVVMSKILKNGENLNSSEEVKKRLDQWVQEGFLDSTDKGYIFKREVIESEEL